jgi:2-oxo-3-hexenedioate decarboxylase
MQAEAIARDVLRSIDRALQIPPFTTHLPNFGASEAYAVTAAIRKLRTERGETPVGRKIGFTNRSIWEQFNIDAPIWGDMYLHTVQRLRPNTIFKLDSASEPLIEPEIALYLQRAPAPGMQERELLDCIDWVAPGFEIVQSIYPGWKFKGADAIANCGMHHAFLMGEPLSVDARNRDALAESLSTFSVSLHRDRMLMDQGRGDNVLGGPLSALKHLVALLSEDAHNPALAVGEMVTTGTLTRAFPVSSGQAWSTEISGIPLEGLSVRFG